jgi:hypothetical protein
LVRSIRRSPAAPPTYRRRAWSYKNFRVGSVVEELDEDGNNGAGEASQEADIDAMDVDEPSNNHMSSPNDDDDNAGAASQNASSSPAAASVEFISRFSPRYVEPSPVLPSSGDASAIYQQFQQAITFVILATMTAVHSHAVLTPEYSRVIQ